MTLSLVSAARDTRVAEATGLGEQLIFVLSAPRSGSTLLQHIIGSHSDVHALPEPWLMLPLLYGLRQSGTSAEYNAYYASLAIADFVKRVGAGERQGEDLYFEGVRAMANHIYDRSLVGTGKRHFLDKTPRYYFAIPELVRVFPRAKLVLLVRNPLAIFASMVGTVFQGNVWRFIAPGRVEDVLEAPKRLAAAIADPSINAPVIRYEALVSDPEGTVRAACEAIGLPFEASMIDYGGKTRFTDTTFVDPKAIYKHDRPVADYADSWKETLAHPQLNHLADGYLEALGPETVGALGYDFETLRSELRACRDRSQVKFAFGHVPISWDRIAAHAQMSHVEQDALGWLGELSTRGVRATVERRVKKALKTVRERKTGTP